MNKLKVYRGSSADWTFEARLRDGQGVATFEDSDPIRVKLWPGDDRPPILEPPAVWANASAGRFTVSLSDAQTAGLSPGIYQALASTTRGGRTADLATFMVEVLETPGQATPPAVYCTMADLQDHVGWVDQVLDLESDANDFLRQRILAREWLDALILRNYAGSRVDDHMMGFLYGSAAPILPDPWISSLLESGALVLTGPSGRALVRACACYALYLICNAQAAGSEQMRKASLRFRRESRKICHQTAGIDVNGDGVPEIAVWLGNVSVVEG